MSESKDGGGELTSTGGSIPAELITNLLGDTFSPSLQIILNDALYRRCMDVAVKMSRAEGVTPKHLVGKPEACFSVVQMAITWKLAPQMVAGATYSTPNGNIGYEGKLCHAILENSGRIEGQIRGQYYGPWEKIEGKFGIEKKKNKYGNENDVPVQRWKTEDEEGVGVTVIAQVKGEAEPRTMSFDLKSAHPRNSTIWVTRTKQQLWYTAIRAFGNMAMPGIFMGVPFDAGDLESGGMVVAHDPSEPVGPARPVKPAAARAVAKAMDDSFKATVPKARPGTPPVAETVIETEEEQDDATQEQEREADREETDVENDGTGQGDENDPDHEAVDQEEGSGRDGGMGPAPEPAKAAQAAKAPVTPQPKATPTPAPAPKPAPAATPKAAPAAPAAAPAQQRAAIEPFTAQELKEFLKAMETGIVRASDTLAIDSLKAKHAVGMKRLKVTSQDDYDEILANLTAKATAFANDE